MNVASTPANATSAIPRLLLNASSAHNYSEFASGVDGVDRFLRHEALKAHNSLESRTYVWAVDDNVLGYFTLCTTELRSVTGGPKFTKETAPGFLLAKLGLTANAQGKKDGVELLFSAVARAADASEIVGGRFIVVDAADGAHGFYEKFDFTPFKDGSHRLYMKIAAAQLIRDSLTFRTPEPA